MITEYPATSAAAAFWRSVSRRSLPEGSRAIVFYGAANRDPRQFPHPDRFDVQRDNAGRGLRTEAWRQRGNR
jgi:cytochrome P450